MTVIDWLIVLVLNGSVIAVGFYLARGIQTSSDWFLGRRALAWWAVGMSMLATNVDNADLVSLTGLAYKEGLHILSVHTLGSAVGGILAAFFIVPAIYRAGFYTNAEYLESRFGVSTRVLSAIIQIQYRTSMLGLMIWSVYLLLTGLVDLAPNSAWILIVLMVVLAAVYTSWGGLKSVAMTDALQGLIMLIAGAVIFGTVWQACGGWSNALATLGEQAGHHVVHIEEYRGDTGQTSPWIVVIGWITIGGGYWTVNHTQTMRLLGSRSLWDMKMAALFGVALSMPVMIGCAMIGVMGHALHPDFAAPDQLYPFLTDRYLGAGLKGLVVAGILAAAISTFDSMGSSLSALFTRDIYARLLVRDRDDAHYLKVTRFATVGILAIGFAYIPFISSKDTMLKAFLTLIPVFVTPLFTIYVVGIFTRAHRKSGIVGLLVGSTFGMAALMDREIIDVAWLPWWFTGRWEAFPWAMFFTVLGMAATTIQLGKCEDQADPVESIESTGWLRTSRQGLPPLKEHPFSERVPRWLRPAWLAAALLGIAAYLVFGLFW